MLIGVISDTHDQLGALDKAIAYLRKKQVEHVLHAGDFIAPFSVKKLADLRCPVTAVYGNNDGERNGIRSAFAEWGTVHARVARIELGERRILMVHEPDFVEEAAASGLYDVVIHGHTHEVGTREAGGALIINPGSTGGVPDVPPTCVILDLEKLKAKVHQLD
jgi:putative phosphoesterase